MSHSVLVVDMLWFHYGEKCSVVDDPRRYDGLQELDYFIEHEASGDDAKLEQDRPEHWTESREVSVAATIREWMVRETWLDAVTAVDLGFADAIAQCEERRTA